MPRSFRFEPPTPGPNLLTRPRLLRALLGRWDHRVVSVVGGPGLGKTTLLGQAVGENLLAPRGQDVWIGLEPGDADGETLARSVAAAVGDPSAVPDASSVADALWRRSPAEVCLVLDDVHLLPPESPGARWLGQLVAALPANGHILLASRSEPPLALTRLRTQGAVVAVGEDDLRFTPDEVSGFAARRGLDAERFEDTGGWPAMAELAASIERHLAGAYVWEEVLEPLGPERRRVLSVVCDLGGADDDLASAALGYPVDVAEALDGVPLVAVGEDGVRVPHPLWRTVPGIELAPVERAAARGRAVELLVGLDRFDEAFALVSDASLWERAPAVLRAACLAADRPTSGQLRRWLSACPPAVRAGPAGRLAAAMLAAFTAPAEAIEPLNEAAGLCRAEGDIDAELVALAELGRVAWWHQNLEAVGPVGARVAELAETGHPLARGLAGVGRAVVADLVGDDAGVLQAIDAIEAGALDPVWEASMRWFRARILLSMGEPAASLEILDSTDPGRDPAMRAIFGTLRLGARWSLGRIDDVLAAIPVAADAQSSAGVEHNRRLASISASLIFSHVGRVAEAGRHLDDVGALAAGPALDHGVAEALAIASLLLAEGDDEAATAHIRAALDRYGLDRGVDRRAWRSPLTLSYVLVPDTREHWDQAPLRGANATARSLAAAVVAARSLWRPGPWGTAADQAGIERLRRATIPAPDIVRSCLHVRLAAELAVGLVEAGRPEGPALLDSLGPAGREAVRSLAAAHKGRAKPARSLLTAVPAPPPEAIHVALLGPIEVRRRGPEGEEVTDLELRRERVRALLAFLVGHRTTSRPAITAALWPDLDEQSAANNLRVTLTYLSRVLEPWRPAGEPGYLVRSDGPRVELVVGEHLRLDVDRFDHHLRAAAEAETDGTPSLALDHGLAAVELYRGELAAGLPDADWIDLDREHYRSRFVVVATRTAQLLLGRGDVDRAEAVARRALAADRWAEDAYGVLAAAALARGDRSAAGRQLDRCLAALGELGVEPSDATRRLRRRMRGADE